MDIPKDLVAASAAPLVLSILSEGASYGYAILKRVTELSDGQLEWSEGLLYPLLHRLERQGHVHAFWAQSDSGRKRKYYEVTDEGRAALAQHQAQWRAVVATLETTWVQSRKTVPSGANRRVVTA
jgi:DNA-binding PadR family transcriptional regulator